MIWISLRILLLVTIFVGDLECFASDNSSLITFTREDIDRLYKSYYDGDEGLILEKKTQSSFRIGDFKEELETHDESIIKNIKANSSFSQDKREKISDFWKYPYSATLLVGACFDSGSGEIFLPGTCFLIGPRVALTAAHIVYQQKSKQVAKRVVCYFDPRYLYSTNQESSEDNISNIDLSSNNSHNEYLEDNRNNIRDCEFGFFLEVTVSKFSFPHFYKDSSKDGFRSHDYAVLFFDEDVNTSIGDEIFFNTLREVESNLSNVEKEDEDLVKSKVKEKLAQKEHQSSSNIDLKDFNPASLKDNLLNALIPGFPVEAKDTDNPTNSRDVLGDMYYHESSLHYLEENVDSQYSLERNIFHKIDTTGGQSGSPILIKTDDGYFCCGIHTGAYRRWEINRGVLITKEILTDLQMLIDGENEEEIKSKFHIKGD